MIDFLKKIIPGRLKRKIYSAAVLSFRKDHQTRFRAVPQHPLPAEAVKNTRLLLNRSELLKVLPQNGVVAELGVDEGVFSAEILELCQPQRLVLVDVWASRRYHQGKKTLVEAKFDKQRKSGKVQIERGYSIEVAERFPEQHFDWIYIDTDHSYQTTIKELETWAPRIKEDGIIAGHDFVVGNWERLVKYGVIEAVYEFCSRYNWEIIYLTMEHNDHSSFAIRRIK